MSDEGSGIWYVTSGRSECPTCGVQASEVQRPGWWRRFRGWLIHGTRGEHLGVCPNGHEWSWSTLHVLVYGYRRVLLPRALIAAVLHKRKAMPLPIHYVAAAGIGLVLGVALDLLLGWAWWLVAAGVVIVVWLLYLSTAFTGPHRVRLDDLLEPIDWERAQARRRRRLEQAVTSGRLLACGVEGWEGSRSAWGDPAGGQVTLIHGEPSSAEPRLSVETRQEPLDREFAEVTKLDLAAWLVAEESPPPSDPIPEDWWDRDAEIDRARGSVGPWEAATISVDGIDVPCEIVRWQGRWAAILEVEDCWIQVTASGVDSAEVALTRLTTLEGYE